MQVGSSEQFSSKIAPYCRCRHEELSWAILQKLTYSALIHTIDEKESLYFLSMCVEFHGDPNAGNGNRLYARSLEQVPKLLAKIFSPGENKKECGPLGKLVLWQRQNTLMIYESLPSAVKAIILEKALGSQGKLPLTAKDDTDSETSRTRETEKKIVRLEQEISDEISTAQVGI